MNFDFSTAKKIIFGAGRASEAGALAAERGSRIFVVSGRHPERTRAFVDGLKARGLKVRTFSVVLEPTVDDVRRGTAEARESGCDVVIGVGGGSVLDAGKAIAALAANPGDLMDYLEVIGGGKRLSNPSVPFLALPTTAGTGTEATQNAVIASPEHRVKVSLRSPLMFPDVALVDPLLTVSCPPGVTAVCGFDALTQLIEPYTCTQPNAMIDALCRDGLVRIRRSLLRAFEDGKDAAAREDMAMAALLSGMALSNAKLGAVHGIAAPLGGMTSAPHGTACARLLSEVTDANIRLMREGKGTPGALDRYAEIARILTGDETAPPEAGAGWIRSTAETLRIPPLSEYGLCPSDFHAVAEKALRASSMKGNPVALSVEDIVRILSRAF